MKSFALFMAVVMLATGCATVSAPYYSRLNTADEERLADVKSCAHNGLLISGLIISVVLFPIGLAAGLPMVVVAGEKERSCMIKSGYTYTGDSK